MRGLAIDLLGRPRVRRDGEAVPAPRGHKPWGLLALLVLAERPPSREALVSLLFGEADDPHGALRWNLSAVRRLLGEGALLEGDPVRLVLPPGTAVDVEVLARGTWPEAVALPGLEAPLLEGLAFDACPAFDLWLSGERRRLAGVADGVLREAARARLGGGDAEAAARLAGRLVARDPFDEASQTLYVRALAATGDGVGAARHAARAAALLRSELGVEPSPALAAAARTTTARPVAGPVPGRAAARAQLEAGEAAIAAGALEAGLECLRRAVADAGAAGDEALRGRALVTLGRALVRAARGRDEEAATALHEALGVAERDGLAEVEAAAARELGYVEFLRARYDRAQAWLARAEARAGGDAAELGRIGSVLGSVLSDTGHYAEALARLEAAEAASAAAGDRRQAIYARAMRGRARLLRGELDEARALLDAAVAGCDREGWTAYAPWPRALRADVDLACGEVEAAAERLEDAFALGCQLGDPCWEGLAARGLGLVAAARGEVEAAVGWLQDARARCRRLPDAYVWVEAYALDALCGVAIGHGLPSAPASAAELEALASRTGMRELAARALGHRAALGDPGAAAAAAALASAIDNPALAPPGPLPASAA